MLTVNLDNLDKLMLLTEEVKCLSFLNCLLKDYCSEELKDSRSVASATNLYLLKLNEKTTDRLCKLVFDENFTKSVRK